MSPQLAVPLLADYLYLAQRMRDDERAQFVAMSGLDRYDADAVARGLAAQTGPAWVLVADGLPFLAGGFERLRPGVYDCWLAGTLEGWEKHWRTITKTCNRLMRDLFANGAHRIQTTALASRSQAHRWYASVGLVAEGIHRGYCADGQDAITFARVTA